MSNSNRITIAVVTYHNDFLLLARLLQSIYTYWHPSEIDSICIILNDTPRYYEEFDKVLKNNTHKHFKINKMYSYELAPDMPFFDWHSQQLYKCLISNVVVTDWYVINDCKDYYTQPVEISDLFDEHGRATMHLDHTRFPSDYRVQATPGAAWAPGPFSLALATSFKIFDLDPQDHQVIHFPSTTPFIVKTEIMKGMIVELKGMLKGIFPFLFSIHLDGQCFVTEFLLYGAYCYATTKNKDYVNWDVKHRKFFISVSQSKDLRTAELPINTAQK